MLLWSLHTVPTPLWIVLSFNVSIRVFSCQDSNGYSPREGQGQGFGIRSEFEFQHGPLLLWYGKVAYPHPQDLILPPPTQSSRARSTSPTTSLPSPARISALEGFPKWSQLTLASVNVSVILFISSSCTSSFYPTSTPCSRTLGTLRTDSVLLFESLLHSSHGGGIVDTPFIILPSWKV